ncbi:stringent starvation protein B [Chitinivorax tropicus]|uniref:Stringent starvation protein B n=1 Tax=Chitinivorax tropicus TaxID=714531 RepID=A0A840MQK1_9PROT|nr:ClpXP protease specificity-enhancing factor [Chitinivorax tropicus]MBB5019052.1 stringent starvation protein B [Chitinivorax tropicus]
MSEISTKPYMIRAIHQWCVDNSYTPYLAVAVLDDQVKVPREFVKDGEIVLNIGYGATKGLDIGNDWIMFSARFSGTARDIVVPVGAVISIFARETGTGMSFAPEPTTPPTEPPTAPTSEAGDKPKPRPKLQVIK